VLDGSNAVELPFAALARRSGTKAASPTAASVCSAISSPMKKADWRRSAKWKYQAIIVFEHERNKRAPIRHDKVVSAMSQRSCSS
jgi:hypothetical protein